MSRNDEAVPELLHFVAREDEAKERLEVEQEAFAKLSTLLRRDARVRGPVLDDRFGLGQVLTESSSRPEQDERGYRDSPVDEQLPVG
jgi:hypothetical protein